MVYSVLECFRFSNYCNVLIISYYKFSIRVFFTHFSKTLIIQIMIIIYFLYCVFLPPHILCTYYYGLDNSIFVWKIITKYRCGT